MFVQITQTLSVNLDHVQKVEIRPDGEAYAVYASFAESALCLYSAASEEAARRFISELLPMRVKRSASGQD